jgi:hypothetical protein
LSSAATSVNWIWRVGAVIIGAAFVESLPVSDYDNITVFVSSLLLGSLILI